MPGPTIVTFGELLLRLDTPGYERIAQADHLRVTYTGGEANVAVALAGWGLPARIASRVPDNAIGSACLNHFRRYGVDISHVARGGSRLGILYVESGAAPRPPQVIYDRQHSAFCGLTPDDLDWDGLFADAGWFHFTGTAPAVSELARTTLLAALRQAHDRGIRVSFDCSYRSALWSIAEAAAVLQPLLEYVDVYFGSRSDLSQFFDIDAAGDAAACEFRDRYGLDLVALAERETTADGRSTYTATIWSSAETATSRAYQLASIDRIGAGDAFAAGVIRGINQGQSLQEITEFAAAAAAFKHTIPGDFALCTVAEVERLVEGGMAQRGWR